MVISVKPSSFWCQIPLQWPTVIICYRASSRQQRQHSELQYTIHYIQISSALKTKKKEQSKLGGKAQDEEEKNGLKKREQQEDI